MHWERQLFPASWLRLFLVLALGTCSVASRAQAESEESPRSEAAVFMHRFGVEHLGDLLESGAEAGRLRGIARLGGLGTDRAIERLTTFALERRVDLGAKEWLTLARSLAPHIARPNVELVLAMLINQRPRPEAGPDQLQLFELARCAAALALADAGTASGLAILGRALRTGGSGAGPALEALRAHPPLELAPLLEAPGEPSVELALLLGELGDQRAFHPLRAWVRGQAAEVRAAAALALAELGQMETVPLAREWLEHPLPVLQKAALRILMAAQDLAATRALVARLQSEPNDPELRRLALSYPSGELAAVAQVELGKASASPLDAAPWVSLLGRIGGADNVRSLEMALNRPGLAFIAAHALSRSHDPEATAALERALSQPALGPLAVRALAARAWAKAERANELEARFVELVRSESFALRSAAAWGLSLMGPDATLRELESGDEARVLGAAQNALTFDEPVLARAARLLEAAPPGRIRSALGSVLLRASGRRMLTSSLLRTLVAEAGGARPLALRALSGRGLTEVGSLVQRHMEHPDPVLRAHVARGLGESRARGAVGMLARMFEFETDANVRYAVVCALGELGGGAAERILSLAARLDADERVRSAARLTLLKTPIGDPPRQSEVLWTELRSAATPGDGLGAPAEPVEALVNVAPGLSFAVFVGSDGALVVAGVGLETLGIRLL